MPNNIESEFPVKSYIFELLLISRGLMLLFPVPTTPTIVFPLCLLSSCAAPEHSSDGFPCADLCMTASENPRYAERHSWLQKGKKLRCVVCLSLFFEIEGCGIPPSSFPPAHAPCPEPPY